MLPARIADSELLNAELAVDDAYAIEGIVLEKLPVGMPIVDVIRIYSHVRYPAQKVYCCVCASERHREGFHIRREDGVESLLGSCCAKPIFVGREISFLKERSKRERERQKYLRAIHHAQPTILRIILRKMSTSWRRLAKEISVGRHELSRAMPEIYEALQFAVDKNEMLCAPVRVLQAEWKNSSGQMDDTKNSSKTDRYMLVQQGLYYVSGAEYFARCDPIEIVSDLDNALRDFQTIAADTDAHSLHRLKKLVKQIDRGREGLQKLLLMQKAANEFYDTNHLGRIANWVRLNRKYHANRFR